MEKEMANQVQEVQRVPYRISPRRNMPRHIWIKLTKTKHKERILKAAAATFVVKLVWWYWILLTFACLKSFWFLHQFWMRSLPGNLGCRFFCFSTLNISCHSLLACTVSAERSAVKRMGFPLCVIYCFSLAAFNILSLCLVFVSLIHMCLGMFLLGLILYGTLCTSWTWLAISFSMLGKFSIIIS